MRRALVAATLATLAACGGRTLDEPDDASPDAPVHEEAGADVALPDVAALDVIGVDDSASAPTCEIATTSLLAYYPLDVDTDDHSGHGNHATGANLTPVAGVLGGAMRFDGASSTLRVTSGAAQLQGSRTLCAWGRSDATVGAGQPLFWGGATNQGDFYALFSTAPSDTTCSKTTPSTPYVDHWGTDCFDGASAPVPTGQWTLVCYAFDGASLEMSVNGSETKVPGELYDYALTTLFIGSTLGNGTTTQGSFDGDIDEVSVWSARLQPDEVAALWNGGAGCVL